MYTKYGNIGDDDFQNKNMRYFSHYVPKENHKMPFPTKGEDLFFCISLLNEEDLPYIFPFYRFHD